MKRLTEILDVDPEIKTPDVPSIPERVKGEVEFRNVSFAFDGGRAALSNVNFTIREGSTIAIVGRTGSGKSTLIGLISRLIDPTTGQVLVDGIPTTEWDIQELRSIIGVVPQDALLFSDSLRENIRFGAADASEDAFQRAVTISNIHKDAESFRSGYETMVGERGITLSGGQKGRTALARALLRDPKILILDDALSAVDTQTEEEILQGLREFMSGRTSIIISHRVSTVRAADQIFVLDEGRVVERGSHDELLNLGGYYADLDRMQRLEAELEELDENGKS